MRILLTNDDGIRSPGLWSAARALQQVGQVCVVAPDRDQSGVGTAMTLLRVLRAHEAPSPVEGVVAYAVEGTPADCVVLATGSLFPEPFDLVVSGINHGANMGVDVFVSGTVGAALHGLWRGISSVAISVEAVGDGVRYETASRAARALAKALSAPSVPRPLLLNVNLPDLKPAQPIEVAITTVGPLAYAPTVQRGQDGRRTHYWISHKHNEEINAGAAEGTDIWAVRNQRISITPLQPHFSGNSSAPVFTALAGEIAAELTRD